MVIFFHRSGLSCPLPYVSASAYVGLLDLHALGWPGTVSTPPDMAVARTTAIDVVLRPRPFERPAESQPGAT